ncbi:guanyl-specific ribonuclease T1 precursor [Punctularia strigosozonata HHB-11173 SS5]|uniref:guanyl-specific ribonuclease T1 precursor n=1 Tax=Punctularia strigosozonata (strain HHB-11173) TaxID=741275 RepID=UPI00044167DD|nr:guanyl-specific ribonuclease T1 precursor [Punctularia strigosozonata HHB-11173 SS5]EIN12043.1 guanyl-specific ribonuclease T1 precursor [Punctularia strigosozonata HHB-11173 SS5]
MFSSIAIGMLVVSGVVSALPQRRALPSGTVTCGSHKYSVSQVSSAVSQGYKDYKAGTEVGSNDYPHTFRNDEGLKLYCSGSSWEEFPILTSGVYTGGSPGADRVIFDTSGTYCAVATHTGASSTNGFVSCQGD